MVSLGLSAVVAVLAGLFLWGMRSATNGAFAPPLDDTFIYLQYAKLIAQGHPLSYSPGAPPTAGATSFLYPFLLAPGDLLGLRGESFLRYAYALNVVFLYITSILIYLLTRRLTNHWLAMLGTSLTVLAGPVLWGFFSMMEIGLLSVVVVTVVYFFVMELGAPLPWRTVLFSCVLALSRPEGAIMAGLVVLVIGARLALGVVGTEIGHRRQLMQDHEPVSVRASPDPRPALLFTQVALLLLPVITAVAWTILTRIATGSLSSSAFASKSILVAPLVPWFEKVGLIFSNTAVLLQDPFALNPTYLPILLLPLIGLGLARQIGEEIHQRMPSVGTLVLGLILISALSASQAAGVLLQHYRYNIALFPLAMVFVMMGLQVFTLWFREGRFVSLGIGALALVLMLVTTPRWIQIYAKNARDIHNQQVFLGRWINQNLPSGSIVALNDAGAMAYYGDHAIYDLVGLVSNGASIPFRHGTGAIFERILILPPEDRPGYFAIFPHWFAFPVGGFLTEVFRTRLNETSITAGDTVVIYRADYAATKRRGEPAQDHSEGGKWVLIDSLNVADLEDETLHDYRQRDFIARGPRAVTVLRELNYAPPLGSRVIDGGRVILGSEQFSVLTKRGKDLKVVMRTDAFFAVSLRVYANGQLVGQWTYPKQGAAWVEPSFVVPGKFVNEGHTRLRIVLNDTTGLSDYAPFRYWFYQSPQ